MSGAGRKRPRMSMTKRPIDKKLVNVFHGNPGTQVSTDLTTATFPCTITGLRWAIKNSGLNNVHWCIIVLRDGMTADTIATSDGSTLYNPEQDVLAFGVQKDDSMTAEGSTKTMRKLQGGDKIVFLSKAAASGGTTSGIIQLFCKT